MNRKVIILVISIIVVLIILSTTTYALFFRKDKLENTESYTAGILDIVIENDEEGLGETLNLTNSLPITDEEGKKSNPYKFKITNKGNLSYTFDLLLNNTTTSNQINADYIKIMVDNNEPVTLSNLDNNIIASDLTLNPGESKIISIRIWLDINTPNSEIGKSFSAKITSDGIGSEVPEAINLDISKGAITIDKGNSDNTLLVSGGGLTLEQEISNTKKISVSGNYVYNDGNTNRISINSGIVNLELKDVTIDLSNYSFSSANLASNATPITINSGIVELLIEGENLLKTGNDGFMNEGGNSVAGISVSTGAELKIDGSGKLTIDGSATGDNSAAIGGNGHCVGFSAGLITISDSVTIDTISYYTDVGNGFSCFVVGTPVLTKDGYISIENIKIGDYVLSRNDKDFTTSYEQVIDLKISKSAEFNVIRTANNEVKVTPKHRFFVENKGWISAENIKVGDIIMSSDNFIKEKVIYNKHILLDEAINVYNFTVNKNHTYFVGNGLFVHNVKIPVKCDVNVGIT